MTAFAPELAANDDTLRTAFSQLQWRRDIAEMLEVPAAYLNRVLYVRRERRHYTTVQIRKRSGDIRTLQVPPPSLSVLQHKLNRVFSVVYAPKPCVHGFVLKRSIVSNASLHAGKRWLLNVDLKDFFPSIHFGRVRGALMAAPFHLNAECATAIAQICTTDDGELPQGAPTSPVIANIVCLRLDASLMSLARRQRMTYSRYCDDLSFSTRRHDFPVDVAVAGGGWIGEDIAIGPALREVLRANGFEANPKKTRLQLRSCRQEVTGLTVNEFPNVPRAFVRSLRAMIYNWRAHGLASAAREYFEHHHYGSAIVGSVEERFKRVLLGRVQHVGMVKGWRDPVYCKLRDLLHARDASLIEPAPAPTAYRSPTIGRGGDAWTRVFQRVADRVLHLVASDTASGSGTAFAIDREHFATAAHNLKLGPTVWVHGPSTVWPIASALLHAQGAGRIDVGLLQSAHGIEPLLHSDRMPSPGEQIAIIGFATVPGRHPGVGLYPGAVESIRWDYSRTIPFIQVSVASGGGLSGSPLLDIHGQVLGIVIESRYEQTANGVPHREYCTVLPIKYALEIDRRGTAVELPITDEGHARQLRLFPL